MKRVAKYPNPPKRAFRAMGLGVLKDGSIKVVAGFRGRYWDPMNSVEPLFVQARVIRLKGGQPK